MLNENRTNNIKGFFDFPAATNKTFLALVNMVCIESGEMLMLGDLIIHQISPICSSCRSEVI